jgi:mitochondrial fission protein ELM1
MKSMPPGHDTLKEAQHYIYYDGSLRVIIFDFLAGSAKKFKDVTPKIMQQLGVSLGRLHHPFQLTNRKIASITNPSRSSAASIWRQSNRTIY